MTRIPTSVTNSGAGLTGSTAGAKECRTLDNNDNPQPLDPDAYWKLAAKLLDCKNETIVPESFNAEEIAKLSPDDLIQIREVNFEPTGLVPGAVQEATMTFHLHPKSSCKCGGYRYFWPVEVKGWKGDPLERLICRDCGRPNWYMRLRYWLLGYKSNDQVRH